MHRACKHLGNRPPFDDPAGEHNGHVVTILSNDSEIMGNDQRCCALGPYELPQQVQHLCLHRHIQPGGRFVGYHQLRLVHQGHGNHHALRHAARQLMRISAVTRLRIWNAHSAQDLNGALACSRGRQLAVRPYQSHQLVAHTGHRLQSGPGILGHKTNLGAAYLVECRTPQAQQINTFKKDFSCHLC